MEMLGNREPHEASGRSLSLDGDVAARLENHRLDIGNDDLSPLVRIAVALEGVRAECRRIADSVEGHDPPTAVQIRQPQGDQGLPGEVPLATQEQPRPSSRSPYLGAEEAAEYLGVSVSSLYGIVERGHLVPLRGPRRSYRFTEKMLDDYLKRRQ